MRKILLVIIFSIAFVIALSERVHAQEYSITEISPATGPLTRAQGINNYGVVVGRLQYYMFVWTNGVMQVITPLGISGATVPNVGMNDAGSYCGTVSTTGYQHGFVNSTDLGFGRAYDINNQGQVTGWNLTGVYIYHNGNFEYLPYNKVGTEPLAINDSGHVVGYYGTSLDPYTSEPFIYKDSAVTLLGRLGGTYAEANDINNKEQIVGWSSITPDDVMYRGFIWYNGNWTIIPTLGGNGSEANAINDYGVVVGEVKNASNAPRAFVYDTVQGLRDLNNLISGGSGWDLWSAYDINNAGQIVGVGFLNGNLRGFLLTPNDSGQISLTNPTAGELLIAGEKDTIRWTDHNAGSITISVILHDGQPDETVVPIVDAYPVNIGFYEWDVPDSLLSRKCRIVIKDAANPDIADTSGLIKIKSHILTRLAQDGEYEAFHPAIHGWSFSNSAGNMWPSSWWSNFDYDNDLDPFTNNPYPAEIANFTVSSDFPDWPLFVKTFGLDYCYIQMQDASVRYRQSAILKWSAIKGNWGGSCFGFALTSYLIFDYLPEFYSRFSEIGSFTDLYSLSINDIHRKIINENFLHQFGQVFNEHSAQNFNKTPSQTLEEVKEMLLSEDRSEKGLLLYNQGGAGAHIINPYRAEKFGGNPNFWWIYVYDSNIPGDPSQRVFINTLSNLWSYGGLNWSGNAGLFLTNPIWNYLVNPIPTQQPNTVSPITSIQVFSNPASSILITDAAGKSIGYADSTVIDSMDNAFPIIPIIGKEHPPIGYYLPVGEYSVAVSNFSDSISRVSFHTDSVVCSYRRVNALPDDSDYISWQNGAVTLFNPNPISKPSTLQYVIVEPQDEKAYTLAVSQTPGDSLRVSSVSNQNLLITNFGSGTSYDVAINHVSYQVSGQFEHRNIVLQPNTSHQLVPSWNDLQQPVKILIDNGNDGLIDDSLLVNNQVTGVRDESMSGIPSEFKLYQNYPNPFNPSTVIRYQLPVNSYVTLKIYDVLGREVAVLVDGMQEAGYKSVEWNSKNLPSSVYYYRLQSGDFIQTKRMALIK